MAESWTPKDDYSPSNHNHDTKYAPSGHNHDSAYAAKSHNHDTVYSKTSHNHDTVYSKLSHLHDERYSQTSHNHDSVYSKLGHVHDYAAKDHNHDSVYSKLSHNHDDKYYTESEVDTLVTGILKYPDYANEDVLDEKTTTYTATQNGWIFAYARREGTYWHVCINGKRVWATGGSDYDAGSCFLPIKSGDVVAIYRGNGTDDEAEDPYDGALLKFYPNR